MIRLRCTLIVFLRWLADRASDGAARLAFETTLLVGEGEVRWRWCQCGRVHYPSAVCLPRDCAIEPAVILWRSGPPARHVPYLSLHKAREDGALAAAVRAADLRDAQEQKVRASALTRRRSFGHRS